MQVRCMHASWHGFWAHDHLGTYLILSANCFMERHYINILAHNASLAEDTWLL
jgi:hypothetical protein